MLTIPSYQAVRETTRSSGTGPIKLDGPELGYQALGDVGDGNECDFCIRERGGKNWEVVTGIYTAATQTLTRATVIASSNGDQLVDFPAGIKVVTLVSVPVVKSATVTLTAADLAVLDTVPFELVAAPGAGKILVPANGGVMVALCQPNGGINPQNETGFLGAYFNGSPPTYSFAEPFNLSELYMWLATVDQVMFSQASSGSKGAPRPAAENTSVVLVADDTLLVPGAIATSSIGAAGTGYEALDELAIGDATIRVDTVGGSGEVLTYTVTVAGTNNVVGAAQATTGGSGADFTLDIDTLDYSVNPMTLKVKTLYSVMDAA